MTVNMKGISNVLNPMVGKISHTLVALHEEQKPLAAIAPEMQGVLEDTKKRTSVSMGDTVSFSEEGQSLAKSFSGPRNINKGVSKEDEEKEADEDSQDALIKNAEKRIEEIKEEIEEIKNSSLPEKEKQMKISMLTQELAVQTEILMKAQQNQDGLDGVKELALL